MIGFERARAVLAIGVGLLMLASTGVPLHAGAHCAGMEPATPEHHGAPHHSFPNNTQVPGPDRCPHCPPADCASEAACSAAVVATAEAAATTPPPCPGAALPAWVPPAPGLTGAPPPTPPPQALLPNV